MVRVCGNHDDAEDVLVQALLKAHQSAGSLRRDDAFRAWVAIVGRRIGGRMKRREALAPILSLPPEEVEGRAGSGRTEDDWAEAIDTKACVNRAQATLPFIRRGEARPATAVAFAVPSLVAVFSVRHWLVPALSPTFQLAGRTVTKDSATLLLFAALMVGTGYRMIASGYVQPSHRSRLWIASAGLVVGVLAGLLGAGGGFLIVPVLALGAGLEMRAAVGTSLAIIALQSGVGFAGDLLAHPRFVWPLLLGGTTCAGR